MAIDPSSISIRQDLFGGSGRVAVATILSESNPFVITLWCALDIGGTVGPHRQSEYPEQIVCVSGDGEVKIDGVKRQFSAGDAHHVPLGTVLSLKNLGDVALEYLIIKAKNSDSPVV